MKLDQVTHNTPEGAVHRASIKNMAGDTVISYETMKSPEAALEGLESFLEDFNHIAFY